MKRFFNYLTLAAIAATALISCNKEKETIVPEQETVSFTFVSDKPQLFDADTRTVYEDGTIEYTPMQDWASFVSFSYGKKVQAMCMLGYMKQLGTTKDVTTIWINNSADQHIQQAFRATPTVAWNLGKFTVSLEYNLTAAEFGSGARNARGMYDGDKEWILNHRFICMTKFNF